VYKWRSFGLTNVIDTDIRAAGKGRTGTVLAAYVCASQGISPGEAVKVVRAKRSGSIEKNSGQEESVSEYAKFLQDRKQK
jgi:atypical dual specificity phosphatase